ncbi:unnamed protein product [Ophioblennius macclurei]
MSAGGQSTRCRDIPAVRRVAIHDVSQMPQDYCSSPGGTLFCTTPGGTRIIYDRKFLLQCRSSPLTRTPPNLPDIPGVTKPLKADSSSDASHTEATPTKSAAADDDHNANAEESAGEDAQFEMDM